MHLECIPSSSIAGVSRCGHCGHHGWSVAWNSDGMSITNNIINTWLLSKCRLIDIEEYICKPFSLVELGDTCHSDHGFIPYGQHIRDMVSIFLDG